MIPFDPTLYLVTDRRFCRGRTLVEMVERAVQGGATMVQLREKGGSVLEISEMANALLKTLKPHGVPLIVNDHLEVARQVGAQGIHLGQRDVAPQLARELLGQKAIIGFSVSSLTDLKNAPLSCINYIAASPVFPSNTKTDAATALSIRGLKDLRRHCPLPLVAIGGITLEKVDAVFRAGADGIALVSGLLDARDVRETTRGFAARVSKCKASA